MSFCPDGLFAANFATNIHFTSLAPPPNMQREFGDDRKGAPHDDSDFEVEDDPEIEELGNLFEHYSPWLSAQLNHMAHTELSFTSPPSFTVCFIKGADVKEWAWPQPWLEARDAGRIQLTVTFNNEYARKHSSNLLIHHSAYTLWC